MQKFALVVITNCAHARLGGLRGAAWHARTHAVLLEGLTRVLSGHHADEEAWRVQGSEARWKLKGNGRALADGIYMSGEA